MRTSIFHEKRTRRFSFSREKFPSTISRNQLSPGSGIQVRPEGEPRLDGKDRLDVACVPTGSVSGIDLSSVPLPLFFTLPPTQNDVQTDSLINTNEWVVENVGVHKLTRHVEDVKRLVVKNPLARERGVLLFQSSKETFHDDAFVSLDDG